MGVKDAGATPDIVYYMGFSGWSEAQNQKEKKDENTLWSLQNMKVIEGTVTKLISPGFG